MQIKLHMQGGTYYMHFFCYTCTHKATSKTIIPSSKQESSVLCFFPLLHVAKQYTFKWVKFPKQQANKNLKLDLMLQYHGSKWGLRKCPIPSA